MTWNDAIFEGLHCAKPSFVHAISVVAALAAGLGARPALAVEPSRCTLMIVESDASVRNRWPDLPAQIRATFETRGDVDTCARVELLTSRTAIVLRVALPDGRTAARSVVRREDVLPALEALLLLPDARESTTSEKSGDATTARAELIAPPVRTAAPLAQQLHEAPTTPPAASSRHMRADLSVAAGVRVGDGHMGVGLGLVSFLEIERWLLGFQGRLDLYQPVGEGDRAQPMVESGRATALELGVLAGRRVRFGVGTLDLAAGPALVLHAGTSSMTQPAGTATVMSQTRSDQALPRMVVSSRLSIGRRSSLRSFVEADGEIGRTGASSDPSLGPPRLPAWTVGLAIGAVVGTP
jgi:hypothetical protein